MKKEKFTHKIIVRCTDEQYDAISRKSKDIGVPIAQVARFMLFGGQRKRNDLNLYDKIDLLDAKLHALSAFKMGFKNIDDKNLHDLQMEIKRVGINVNQIARDLNVNGVKSEKDLQKIREVEKKIDMVLGRLGCLW